MSGIHLTQSPLTDYDINVFCDLVTSELDAFDKLEAEPETIEYFDGLSERISSILTLISYPNDNPYINTYIHLDDVSFIKKVLLSQKENLEELILGTFLNDDSGTYYIMSKSEINPAIEDFCRIKRLLSDLDKIAEPVSNA